MDFPSKNSNFSNFISESDKFKLKEEIFKKKILNLKQKEKFINQLPYNEDTPRLAFTTNTSCKQKVQNWFQFGFIVGSMWSIASNKFAFGLESGLSPIQFTRHLLKMSVLLGVILAPFGLMSQRCQINNRNDMTTQEIREIVFNKLSRDYDLYDHLDALLELKGKYSLFEMEQLNKELRERRRNVTIENMEKVREIREKKKFL